MLKKVLTAIILMGLLSLFGCANTQDKEPTESTLPGADVIYPTVLVGGECYQWRRGLAVMNEDVVNNSTSDPNEFLKNMVFYGEIIKGSSDHPEQDRELACVFDVSGSIYLDPNDENVVYLWLTTDWLEDGVIAFDRVNLPEEKLMDVSDTGFVDVQIQPRRFMTGYTGYVDECTFYVFKDEFNECDYDGDGKIDRLYRIDDVAPYMSEYRIDFGNGDKLYSGNVSETAYPHVFPVDLDGDGDDDIVLTYTVEPADREPFTWCEIYSCDKRHHVYMKEDSILKSSGGISCLPVKLQRISSREAAFTVMDTDFTGFIGLDRYYQQYDSDGIEQFWESIESNDNIINAMIVSAEVEYGDDPYIHCYADTVNGGWYYLGFDIVFEDGEYRIKNINKCFDPFSIEFSDYATPGIIPIYVPSDAELEKVQISPDDPYAGMITSICDFNEDGNIEKVVVDYRDILADGIAVPGRVIVYDADGNVQWNDIFALAYAGGCRFYIAEIDNSPYLIRYFPPIERQGNWECSLQVYSMNSDNEFIMSEVISCDGTKESVEECKTIAEQYLEHAVMLVSTMDSELKVYK